MSAVPVIEAFQAVLDAEPSRRNEILLDLERRAPAVADHCRRLLAALDQAEGERFLEAPTPLLAPLKEAILPARLNPINPSAETPPTIPGYTLSRLIGRGGFGQVWMAQNTTTKAFCAAKLIPLADGVELDGLRRLTNAVADHQGLVSIEHVGSEGDWLYAIMPLADSAESSGPVQNPGAYRPLTLRTYAARSLRMDAAEVAAIGADVARGLSALHDSGLAHGDVKPENIFRFEGRWRLGDYSVVHPVDAPSPGGTREYFPPEGGGGVGADQFALASTLFWMATGLPPASLESWISGSSTTGPQPVARSLERVLRRAGDPDPRKRFANVREMAQALSHHDVERDKASIGFRAIAIATAVCGVIAAGLGLAVTGRLSGQDREPVVSSPPQPASAPADILEAKVTFGTIEHSLDEHGSVSSVLGRFGELPTLVCGIDQFSLTAELAHPAYVVAMYLRPDGSVFLCVPDREDQEPLQRRQVAFPSHRSNAWYELSADDGAGQAGLIIVASQQPLPPFSSWILGQNLRESWGSDVPPGDPAPSWWRFDGLRLSPIGTENRNVGEPRPLGTIRPARVDLMVRELEPLFNQGCDVHALFFPVFPGR